MGEPTNSRELVRAISAEFDRRGWDDSKDLALAITTATARGGQLDASAGAEQADGPFLERNGITRATLCKALVQVFADRVFVEEDRSGPTFVDQSITIGDNNTINGSVNAGGNQLVLTENSSPTDILNALTEFVSAGIVHGFSPNELELLDQLAAAKGLDPKRLEDAVRAGMERGDPEPGRLAKFRDAVIGSTTSGLAVQAIMAVIGSL